MTLIHGFGDYTGRFAYYAKPFAENGYDFVGMDMRGFGRSEGRRGIVESKEIIMDDFLTYTERMN